MKGGGNIPDDLDPTFRLNILCDGTVPLASLQPANKLVQPALLLLLDRGVLTAVIDANRQTLPVELLRSRLPVGGLRGGLAARPYDSGNDGVVGERLVQGRFGSDAILQQDDVGGECDDGSELVR